MRSPKLVPLFVIFLAAPLALPTIDRVSGAHASGEENKDAVLIGAGDIADCSDLSGAEATAKLLEANPGTVMALGDLAYPNGSPEDFNCYDHTWGRVKDRTRPAVGNHEFHSTGATYYFRYFGAAAGDPKTGYYSYELGSWHVVVLNSECKEIGGCQTGSPQEKWLREDLAKHHTDCTVAYLHKPRFSSGLNHGDDLEVTPLYQALYDYNAELVIAGHDHDYERFAPQDPNGKADPKRGLREFVVAEKAIVNSVPKSPTAKPATTMPMAC